MSNVSDVSIKMRSLRSTRWQIAAKCGRARSAQEPILYHQRYTDRKTLNEDFTARFPDDASRSAAVRGFCYRFLLASNGIELRPEYKPLSEPPAPKVLRALRLAP